MLLGERQLQLWRRRIPRRRRWRATSLAVAKSNREFMFCMVPANLKSLEMEKSTMRRTKRNLHGFGWVNISKLAAAAVLLTACLSFRTAAQQHGQKTFSTADDAVSTLVT